MNEESKTDTFDIDYIIEHILNEPDLRRGLRQVYPNKRDFDIIASNLIYIRDNIKYITLYLNGEPTEIDPKKILEYARYISFEV